MFKTPIISKAKYINEIKGLSQLLYLEDAQVSEYRKAMSKVFSGFVLNDLYYPSQTGRLVITRLNYNPDLQSTDKNDINDLVVQIVIVKTNRIAQLNRMKDLKTNAGSIIKLINKEYSLE